MRWFWIDRFTEFVSGERAVAIKNVAMAEEQMVDYMPGYPVMPSSLVVEGVAQTGGLLVGQHNAFRERVVLAKLSKAVFHTQAVPGDTLTYTAIVEDIKPDGAIMRGTSHIGETLHAELEVVFAHLDDRFDGVDLFHPADFLAMLRQLRIFDVGKRPDGTPIQIPEHMLVAEQARIAND